MSYRELLRAQLEDHEGRRDKPYTDTEGKLTIGIGHNLTDKGVSPAVIDLLYQEDVDDAERDARALLADFDGLNDVRKAVVCNLAFNLGRQRLALFVATILAINEKRWADAERHLLNSKWARQVKARRAKPLAAALRTGAWP